MKKLTALLLLTCVVFVSSISYAFVLPDQAGHVTDPVGLFSSSEISRMEEAATSGKYELFVLTESGLEEDEGETLASDAYEQWGLSSNQLMLVITVNPNYVHLVFDNIALKNAIARSSARDVTGVIEQSFVPLASDGRVADGVIAVSKLVNEIAANFETSTSNTGVVSQPSGSSNQGTTSTSPSTGSLNSNASSNSSNPSSLILLIIGTIAVFIGVLIIVSLFVKRNRVRNRLTHALKKTEEASTIISKIMISELFKELEQGFIQGLTKQKLSEIEKSVFQLHQRLQTIVGKIGEQKITIGNATQAQKLVEGLEQESDKLLHESKQFANEFEQIERASVEVRRSVENAKERASQVTKLVEALAAETKYPLTHLRAELAQAMEAMTTADNQDEFDVLQAEQHVKRAHQLFDELEVAIETLKVQGKKSIELPSQIKQTEEQLRSIVQREQLLLTDADPFQILGKAEDLLNQITSHLQSGNSKALVSTMETAHRYITDAEEVVQRMIVHRNESQKTIREIDQLLIEHSSFSNQIDQELSKVINLYAERHIHEQKSRIEQIDRAKKRLETLLESIRTNSDIRVQRYADAYAQSEEATRYIAEIKQVRETFFTYFATLEAKRTQLQQASAQMRSQFLKASATFNNLHMQVNPFTGQVAKIEEGLRNLESLFEQPPYDVTLMEQRNQEIRPMLEQYVHAVAQLQREKQMAEQNLRQFQDLYMRSRQRYGSRISMSRYSGSYQQLQRQIEHLIAIGMFAEAMKHINDGQSIIRQMEKEYRRVLEEERRRNSGPPNFGGGGFSGGSGWGSGSGRTSGSSSWGSSSGRSSGGSSWGGGGGRSSGSSSWGGGKSSGSSKW